MSLLKKGSKGSAVKDLQAKLNKADPKPKPPLKEDGIFGPLTDKAVRNYQKKNGLAVDGKVGPYTLATIKNSGKLPEMTVRDYNKQTETFQKAWLHNQASVTGLLAVQSEIDGLNTVWAKEIRNADVLFGANYKYWEQVNKLCEKLVNKQKEFETVLLENPKKAKVLVKECEALDAQIETIGNSNIRPNQIKSGKSIAAARAKLDSATRAIQSGMDTINKRNEAFKF